MCRGWQGHLAEAVRVGRRQEGAHFEHLRNMGREARWPRPRPGSSQVEAGGSLSRPSHARGRLGFDPGAEKEGFKQA